MLKSEYLQKANLIPVRPNTEQANALGLVFMHCKTFNHFGGADIEYHTQVLKSAAGYYIGSLFCESIDGVEGETEPVLLWQPYDRDSARYWKTREEGEAALIANNYEPNIF